MAVWSQSSGKSILASTLALMSLYGCMWSCLHFRKNPVDCIHILKGHKLRPMSIPRQRVISAVYTKYSQGSRVHTPGLSGPTQKTLQKTCDALASTCEALALSGLG